MTRDEGTRLITETDTPELAVPLLSARVRENVARGAYLTDEAAARTAAAGPSGTESG